MAQLLSFVGHGQSGRIVCAGRGAFHLFSRCCGILLHLDLTEFLNLLVNGKTVFYGFVFTKQRDKTNGGGVIRCTAYDQIRYLKNKDTYVYVAHVICLCDQGVFRAVPVIFLCQIPKAIPALSFVGHGQSGRIVCAGRGAFHLFSRVLFFKLL